MALIETVDLWKTYIMGSEEIHALRGVSLQIERGEYVAIMGPSGSGKSTLMNLIGCLDTPTKGSYLLNGKQVSQMNDNELARIRNEEIGFVFQTFNLLPRATALHNVELPLVYAGVSAKDRQERAKGALTKVELAERMGHRPNELSGGQRQRVALARAIVNEPQVLLLDEPLGALDLKLRQEMQLELQHVQREVGITFVYVTHDQEEALSMSDRIAVLSRGRIEQVGTPLEVYERPATDFVAGFIGISNVIERDGRHITIRPEKIQMLEADQQPPAGFHIETGTIKEVVYVGVSTRYTIALDAGGELVVAKQNEQAPEATHDISGRPARIAWSPEQTSAVSQGVGART